MYGCCVLDHICVQALIVGVNLVLVISLRVLSVEKCACVRACGFSPVRLNPMSHAVSPMCLDQLSPITSCNRFCESRFVGVTSQDFSMTMMNVRSIRWLTAHRSLYNSMLMI